MCLSWNNIYIYIYILDFMYPLRCLRVPPGERVPQVEYHWSIGPKHVVFVAFLNNWLVISYQLFIDWHTACVDCTFYTIVYGEVKKNMARDSGAVVVITLSDVRIELGWLGVIMALL
jgi:hypothetical protein